MDAGDLVPDEVTNNIVKRLQEDDVKTDFARWLSRRQIKAKL